MDWERKAEVLSELGIEDLEILFEGLVNLKVNNRDLEKAKRVEDVAMAVCLGLAKAKARLKEQG